MKSIRKGLRDDELVKDTYGRLECANCEMVMKSEPEPDAVFDLRVCPECGTQYKDLG